MVNLDQQDNLDQYFNNHFNNHFNPGQVNSLLSNKGLNNLKHDPHQVLQSDLYSKDYNSDPNSLEPPDHLPLVFDFKAGQLHLQQDFQCLTLHPSEVRDSKRCARNLKRIRGTLKRLLYSCYYIYALKLWMCINENMLVLIAITLVLLSKNPSNLLPNLIILSDLQHKCFKPYQIVPKP
jgi:hypothetical protein